MTPKDPFLEGTFWDKFWRPIRSPESRDESLEAKDIPIGWPCDTPRE